MNTEKLQITTPTDREIAMTRVFNAPRRLVFDALTKPELVKRWLLGPPGWSMPVCEIDLRVGGKYRYVWRRDSDGTDMGMGGVYREIARPSKIMMTWKWEHGVDETLITLTFRASGNGTEFLMRHEGFTTIGDRDAHNAGWTGTIDKLGAYLKSAG